MTLGFIAYALGILALHYCFKYEDHSPLEYWLISLPVLPLIYLATTVIRYVAELYEMWRKTLTEPMAFSGLATGFTCVGYLSLQDIGAPPIRAHWAFDIMRACYGVGAIFSFWRYT